jgi:hypothetical protein
MSGENSDENGTVPKIIKVNLGVTAILGKIELDTM